MDSSGKLFRFCLRKRSLFVVLLLSLFGWWWQCLPTPLFSAPLATELLAADGTLLSARVAADGQWRMAAADSISPRLLAAVVAFEDRRFYRHPGVDLRAIVRALITNHRAGRTVSGGSTLSMQLARMARGNPPRTVWNKLREVVLATRLELAYSKPELLRLWLDHAPFGGNTVGVSAASLRYFGRGPASLSWAEAAALAVLPNSPGLIHPGRNQDALRQKRDRLLRTLSETGHLSSGDLTLAVLEPLPQQARPLPTAAPHLLQRRSAAEGSGRHRTTLDAELQEEVGQLLLRHHHRLRQNHIYNLAVLVSEVGSGKVVAYHGNVPASVTTQAADVDIVTAPRSPGSLLKPLLYAEALDAGQLLPRAFLPDVPSRFASFVPTNFYDAYDGAVPADAALARSLNIPFVYLLRDFGVARFHERLQRNGFRQLSRPAGHYGLSLILGGGEVTLEEVHHYYLGLARQQLYYHGRLQSNQATDYRGLSAGSGYLTLEALRKLSRPDSEGNYRAFSNSRPVAWKTGTSFGYRDAWAVGTTPAYTVSVWVGNADGAGRPGLVGVQAAAPLLFDIFRALEVRSTAAATWFDPPLDDLRRQASCRVSGSPAGQDCPVLEEWAPRVPLHLPACTHHPLVTVLPDSSWRSDLRCHPAALTTPWFVLPPLQAHFYRRHSHYRSLPPVAADCASALAATSFSPMQLIYPAGRGSLLAARNWTGGLEPLYFAASHHDPEAEVYWHVDGGYLGSTRHYHEMTLELPPGSHSLTLTDRYGNSMHRRFTVD